MLHVSIVYVAIDLLHDLGDGCLLGYVSCVSVLASVLDHVLDSSLSSLYTCGQLDDVLILLDALVLEVSLVHVEIEDHLEEDLKSSSGTIETV